jgi:hypothetical protein
MRPLLTLVALMSFSAVSLADCPTSAIEKVLAAPLDGLKKIEREVSDVQSTEGGVWRIYRKKDGMLQSIVRLDGGESGMSERRLSVVSPKAFGITVTRVDYLRHAFIDQAGPNGTAKRTTDYYYFCDGKLVVPPLEYATVDTAAYAKAGEEEFKAMVLDKDVSGFTRALAH